MARPLPKSNRFVAATIWSTRGRSRNARVLKKKRKKETPPLSWRFFFFSFPAHATRSHADDFRLRNPGEHLYREINHRLTWPRYFNTPAYARRPRWVNKWKWINGCNVFAWVWNLLEYARVIFWILFFFFFVDFCGTSWIYWMSFSYFVRETFWYFIVIVVSVSIQFSCIGRISKCFVSSNCSNNFVNRLRGNVDEWTTSDTEAIYCDPFVFYSAQESLLHVRFNQVWPDREGKSKDNPQHPGAHFRRPRAWSATQTGRRGRYTTIFRIRYRKATEYSLEIPISLLDFTRVLWQFLGKLVE